MYSKQQKLELVRKSASRLNFVFPLDMEKWVYQGLPVENYHKHTFWSNFIRPDSATSLDDFIALAKERHNQCYFSGEHGYPGEWLYCYKVCQEKDIKFRYSMEAYWVKDSDPELKDNTNCHIVIIARNYQAMRKLNYICSQAHVSGYYYTPRIDLNQLFSLTKDDVYITSACIAGWKYDDATEIWLSIWKHFGHSFFLEYQANNTPKQKEINDIIYEMSKTFGIQTIIGLDTHYLNEQDKQERNNLLLRKKIQYPEEEGWYMDFPTGDELFDRMIKQNVVPAEDIIYSMMNTYVFINGCEELFYNLDFKIPILPQCQSCSYLERSEHLKQILKNEYSKEEIKSDERQRAVDYEYSQIHESQTADYFLANYNLVKLAIEKYKGQLTPTSRGSASSYYTSKLLGFTTMDRFDAEVPIYPERFITKERIIESHQMPDIDLNVSSQEPFVSAAKEIFGEESCYPLLAVGTLGEKAGFKLYAGIKGIDPQVANEISKSIDKYNEELKNVDDDEKDTVLIEDYIQDKTHLSIFNESKAYQGIIEQAKCHACGFMLFNGNPNQKDVVGYGDIRYEIGLIRCVSKSGKSTVVCNIEGGLLDYYGYVKDDFLIVDVVTIIYKLYEAINKPVPTTRQLRQMVSGDTLTWNLYSIGATQGLNQCERKATTEKVKRYKPQNIKELAAFIAGIRPGFKSHIEGFINRIHYTNGEKMIDDLLKDCFNYMLYQEAIMKIFSWLGIPMKDSYDTIKKISKKKLKGEALKKLEDNLKEHWFKEVSNLDNFGKVYQVIKDSSRYAFNSPHALAMANDSLYAAYVKAHYPSVFYETELNHYLLKDNKNKIALLLSEAVTFFGYKNGEYTYGTDTTKFTIDDTTKIIYPSLSSIKGIGNGAALSVYQLSKQGLKNFVEVYISAVYSKTQDKISRPNFIKLINIEYFRQFGTVKQLCTIVGIADKYYGKKTVKKKDLPSDLPENVLKYLDDTIKNGHSETQYRILNDVKFVENYAAFVPTDEFPQTKLAALAFGVLGYLNKTYDIEDNRYVIISDLDDRYSPKFKAICLKTNTTAEMKIYKSPPKRNFTVKTTYKDTPIKNGMVIYINRCEKRPKQRMIEGKWTTVPNEFEWWITDYKIVENIGEEKSNGGIQ